MSLRIYGATSGYIELDAPAIANSASVTLPTTNGVLATESFANNAGNTLGGLVYITSQSFSSISSVSINNCFSSTYQNYKILITLSSVSSGSINGAARLRSSGVDNSTASSYTMQSIPAQGTNIPTQKDTSDNWLYFFQSSATNTRGSMSAIDICNPFLSSPTAFNGIRSMDFSGTFYLIPASGMHTVASSYDGITLYTTTGGQTFSGEICIYGYRK